MPLLEILEYPDPRLRTRAQAIEVEEINAELHALIESMFATMYHAPGIGLAATQVNVHKRLIVIDVSEDKSEPLVLINPEYQAVDDERELMSEGCLSVPEIQAEIPRALKIQVQALDAQGKPQNFVADGLLAHCIQHECDHLEGRLFVDYLSPLKQQRVRKKLEKRQRTAS